MTRKTSAPMKIIGHSNGKDFLIFKPCPSLCIYAIKHNFDEVVIFPDYLTTLAPSPFITPSTSFRLAMEVSPGVVMANAPWATP